jgi:hypothetical protein
MRDQALTVARLAKVGIVSPPPKSSYGAHVFRSAAKRIAATALRAGHIEHVAQHSEERRVAIDLMRFSVDFSDESHGALAF